MTLTAILQSIRVNDPLILDKDDTEKLSLYITGLERIIKILDKEDKKWI